MDDRLSFTTRARLQRIFRFAAVLLGSVYIVLGVLAFVVVPLRGGALGLVASLLSFALWFALFAVVVMLWGARSLLSASRSTGLNGAVRRRLSLPDLPAKLSAAIALTFFVAFMVLDLYSGKPAPLGVSAWGGYAFGILGAFFTFLMAPLITTPVSQNRKVSRSS